MTDIWTNRLSEYIDGELDSAEQAALETHLKTCGACYATVTELRQVVARAKSLEDTAPSKDLWAGIKTQISEGAHVVPLAARRDRLVRRSFRLTVGQLLAASVALVLLSSGGVWLGLHSRQTITPQPAFTSSNARPRVTTAATWTGQTDVAISELQAALTQNEKRLDTATVRIVRQNLAIIDRAISDARSALQNDPSNSYLNLHLADTMRRKVELLRRVNDLVAAQS